MPNLLDADLEFSEVVNPAVRWCKSGHPIPENLRVYTVKGPKLARSSWGDYCELCVTTAQKIGFERKKLEKAKSLLAEEPEPVDPRLLKIQLRRAGFTGGIAEEEDEKPKKESWEEFLETI